MKGAWIYAGLLAAGLQVAQAGEVDDFINYGFLDTTKANLASGEAEAASSIKAWADQQVTLNTFYSVTNKTDFGGNITANHYASFPPYWWPTCDLPMKQAVTECDFEKRDGEWNNELVGLSGNSEEVANFCIDVTKLSVAAYLYANKAYADRAYFLLNKWFLDEATRMLPNLDFGQMLPGKDGGGGRPYGLIQTRCFVSMVSAMPLLRNVTSEHGEIYTGVQGWFKQFTEWYTTSALGKEEIASANNHGTNSAIQLTSYYRFNEQPAEAIEVVNQFMGGLYQQQVDSNGGQPLELSRADNFEYAMMNLGFLLVLGQLSDSMDHPIWNIPSGNGTTIQSAINYFVPFASGGKTWEGGKGARMEQVTHYFQLAAAIYGDDGHSYLTAIKAVGKTSREATSYYRLYSDYSYGLTSDQLTPLPQTGNGAPGAGNATIPLGGPVPADVPAVPAGTHSSTSTTIPGSVSPVTNPSTPPKIKCRP
ncbi:hypothetical protein H4R34_002864 [Dimargaris verticillata]|uniref:Alginate lyase domain-containing protein n=1 Tax=Dimargaris verticillata TaxID=2761393 RepID=A0A9W8E8V3_9FUNG|nr:hypothetical protein H4R34_002864 [Dimargaris verticillata]